MRFFMRSSSWNKWSDLDLFKYIIIFQRQRLRFIFTVFSFCWQLPSWLFFVRKHFICFLYGFAEWTIEFCAMCLNCLFVVCSVTQETCANRCSLSPSWRGEKLILYPTVHSICIVDNLLTSVFTTIVQN